MNEKLQSALVEILNTVIDAKEFVLAELPDVIIQLLQWHFWLNLIYFIMGVLILACLIAVWVKIITKWFGMFADWSDEEAAGLVFGLGGSSATIIIMVIVCCCINITWVQIMIAPKIFLIEYAANLVK